MHLVVCKMADTKRLLWIDTLKTIGIVLVFMGHSGAPFHDGIYLFHMPLFFIISGFLWNTEKYASMPFSSFIKAKFTAYIIPYLKIASVCLIIFGIIIPLITRVEYDEVATKLIKYLFGILVYSRGTVEWLPQCSPLWFLTCLFFAEVLFFMIMKLNLPLFGVLISGIVGFFMSQIGKYFPWNIDNAFTCLPYLYIGILFKKYWTYIAKVKYLTIAIPFAIVFFFFGEKGTDFDGNQFNNVALVYLESAIICYAMFVGVNVIQPGLFFGGGKFFSLIGRNTLLLMGYNYAINAFLRFIPGMSTSILLIPFSLSLGALFVVCIESEKLNKYKKYLV